MSPTGGFSQLDPQGWTPEPENNRPRNGMVLVPGNPYAPESLLEEQTDVIPDLPVIAEEQQDGPLPEGTPEERGIRVPERQPRTINELYATLGDKGRQSVCGGGIVHLPERVGNATEVRVHIRLAPVFQRFVDEIYAAGYWHLVQRISGYSLKKRRGLSGGALTTLSLCSWGAAIEINAHENQYGHVLPTVPTGNPATTVLAGQPGYRFYDTHPIVEIARSCGLTWGGVNRWAVEGEPRNSKPDGAVFQFMRMWE